MNSRPLEEIDRSRSKTAIYLVSTGLLVGAWLLPDFLFGGYSDVVHTFVLVSLYLLIGRAVLGSILSLSWPTVPSLPADVTLPTVSIVVPAYNEGPVLADTIDAVNRGDYPTDKLDLIICYEAESTDETADIAEAAAAEYAHVRAIEHDDPEGAKARAVNYALQFTTGDIVGQIDADHRLKPDAIRRAVSWFLHDEETWCVQGRCYGKNPAESLVSLHATVERHIAEMADLYGRERLGGFTVFGGGQVFFRADVFEEVGLFDEEMLVEDIDMSTRIHAAGKRLRVDPGIISYEENPPTLRSWWSQRKRWARGWMQVAKCYLTSLPTASTVSPRSKIDATFTFAYAIVPALLVFLLPLPGWYLVRGVPTLTYLTNDWVLWLLLPVAPVFVAYLIFLRDAMAGLDHHPSSISPRSRSGCTSACKRSSS
ncbi:glycosyltransferase [Haloplanus sp. GCM10025708]|uniref:glycosyltransferase n=1 Tax=Haloplanus sp. GCM10025708 TaxID=3252679 RepID=UPI0036161E79